MVKIKSENLVLTMSPFHLEWGLQTMSPLFQNRTVFPSSIPTSQEVETDSSDRNAPSLSPLEIQIPVTTFVMSKKTPR